MLESISFTATAFARELQKGGPTIRMLQATHNRAHKIERDYPRFPNMLRIPGLPTTFPLTGISSYMRGQLIPVHVIRNTGCARFIAGAR